MSGTVTLFPETKFRPCHLTWNLNNELDDDGMEYLNWDVLTLLVKRKRGKKKRWGSQLSRKEKLLKLKKITVLGFILKKIRPCPDEMDVVSLWQAHAETRPLDSRLAAREAGGPQIPELCQ